MWGNGVSCFFLKHCRRWSRILSCWNCNSAGLSPLAAWYMQMQWQICHSPPFLSAAVQLALSLLKAYHHPPPLWTLSCVTGQKPLFCDSTVGCRPSTLGNWCCSSCWAKWMCSSVSSFFSEICLRISGLRSQHFFGATFLLLLGGDETGVESGVGCSDFDLSQYGFSRQTLAFFFTTFPSKLFSSYRPLPVEKDRIHQCI